MKFEVGNVVKHINSKGIVILQRAQHITIFWFILNGRRNEPKCYHYNVLTNAHILEGVKVVSS